MRIKTMNPFSTPPRRSGAPSAAAPSAAPEAAAPLPASTLNLGGEVKENSLLKKLGELKKDDYILIGIIAVLFFEGSDDYILLAALGYLFVMGIL